MKKVEKAKEDNKKMIMNKSRGNNISILIE